MPQFMFGAGLMFATQLQDASGNTISNPTPILLGAMQDVSIDINFETKLLHGSNQFPLAVGRGKGKISGKAKVARMNGLLLNNIIFGQTTADGLLSVHYDTTGSVIPGTPFQITIAPPSSGTFTKDLGVVNNSGLPMTRVASAPATGQYAVNESTGVYTFAAADTGQKVYISYGYSAAVTGADKSTVTNVPMGYAPIFRTDFNISYQGKHLTMTLPNCVGTKFAIGTKLDDFAMPEFDFEAFADAAGNVITWSTSE